MGVTINLQEEILQRCWSVLPEKCPLRKLGYEKFTILWSPWVPYQLATAGFIVEANISRPDLVSSDRLNETALGILEGELKDRQSTAELTRHYQDFCKDEIHYRVPDGENLHDVAARVRRFSDDHDELMDGSGIHLMVGHRNVNKMILKHVLELSFEEGFRIEQEHQRLYLYFGSKKELWSVWVEAEGTRLTRGYTTTKENGYA